MNTNKLVWSKIQLFSNQTERGSWKCWRMPPMNGYYDSMICLPEGKNTDNQKKERKYWVTNRFQIKVSLRMVLNMPLALGQQNIHTKKRQLPLPRVPLCLLCNGQFSFTCVVLMSWPAKHRLLPLLFLKTLSLDKNLFCHTNYI